VGAIDHGDDTPLARSADQLHHWQDQRRGRGDVTQEEDPGAVVHPLPERLDNLVLAHNRQGQRLMTVARSDLGAEKGPGSIQCAIFVVAGQDLVAGRQTQRSRHDVQTGGGVGHEDQIVSAGADEARQLGPGGAHPRGKATLPRQKGHRLRFQFPLPALVGGKDRSGTGAVGAVIQKDHVMA